MNLIRWARRIQPRIDEHASAATHVLHLHDDGPSARVRSGRDALIPVDARRRIHGETGIEAPQGTSRMNYREFNKQLLRETYILWGLMAHLLIYRLKRLTAVSPNVISFLVKSCFTENLITTLATTR